jgi:hypothetical protein
MRERLGERQWARQLVIGGAVSGTGRFAKGDADTSLDPTGPAKMRPGA